MRTDLRVDVSSGLPPGSAQGVVGLQVEPEFGAGAETAGQAQGGIGGDRAIAVDDPADAVGRHAEVARQGVDADAERLHELLKEDFAGGNGIVLLAGHVCGLSGNRRSRRHVRCPGASGNRCAIGR